MSRPMVEAYETLPFLPGAAFAAPAPPAQAAAAVLRPWRLQPRGAARVRAAVDSAEEEEDHHHHEDQRASSTVAAVQRRRRPGRLACVAAERLKECASTAVGLLAL
eukprot:CAMPEP_0115510782 /NCGR_PEP_ID=MMETSP0271-20121206/73609_1 /TAXON_ID=71861 /ORGANISM="Scrippsiella trochoidea, Strain CCMP3099" /LENGTH=105 /DNA_ID=CAMNT_0002940795 /DNA_START=32 /DNA_END=350 /DNA_ORIENTATION=+